MFLSRLTLALVIVAGICIMYFGDAKAGWMYSNGEWVIKNRTVSCVEGVQYMFITSGTQGFMSPVYEASTKQVKLCN